jgi:hypothetical protein
MSMPKIRAALLLFALISISGCASIAKGVTEAILEQGEEEDERACHVEGPSSLGLEALMQEQEDERQADRTGRVLKILMVHGIGRHVPGYSGRLTEHLMRELGLGVRQASYKEVVLRDPQVSEDPLGQLRISRYMNNERTRELLFYELTWSEITEPEKKIIEFDDSTEHAFRRASINAGLKRFFNSHVPDSLIFLGEPHLPILASVRQSFCWMTQGDWAHYADFEERACDLTLGERQRQFKEDDYVIVTHSLGSRIAIDTVQYFGDLVATRTEDHFVELRNIMPEKEIRIYMLANQLPLLEMGQRRTAIRGQIRNYCRPDGGLWDQRLLSKLSIYAFTDPNDILSYPVPPKFADEYIDSRLCPSITNITVNVAKPISLFGLGAFADPGEAHGGYDKDERVIGLMAGGIGHDEAAEIVKERCTWLETAAE